MYTELKDYFENIARSHVDIQHTDNEKHFFRIEAEEYLTKINTAVNYPFLSLESYDTNFNAGNNDNVAMTRQIAFMLVDNYKQGDYDEINRIYDAMEQIALDIINKINYDQKQNIKLVRDFSYNSVSMQSLPPNPVHKYTGVRVTMSFDSKYNTAYNPDKWQ
jgi:hypothetical protein